MLRMEEMCDPHVFFFKMRPYLAGWKNMESVGLEGGVYYGNESKPRVYAGGSNAQSSLIQTLDLILNVDHTATGETKPKANSAENPFMAEMRKYMPGKHADFLVHLGKVNVIRDYVTTHASSNPSLVLAYDASVAMLKSFRDKHIQIVTRYIIIQAQKSKSMGSSGTRTLRAGLAKAKASSTSKKTSESSELKGTGGTSLLPFLKQCRDETGNAAAGSWGKRILTYKNAPAPKPEEQLETKPTFIGLAGQWRNDGAESAQGHW
ncbi:unnamed protein product [Ambrosiozyma monospora]|uniref:Unnamed protein product n=1 Tax=Ambrosiozyma monospora TaxID=43982 RepID=A0ACB5TLM0_AMBMO|nr:unnamed protein product [Ambrosiozyma monospora]